MGLPTLASDIPAHRAFDIEVTNNSELAAKWLVETMSKAPQRTPKTWEWEVSLEKFLSEVGSLLSHY